MFHTQSTARKEPKKDVRYCGDPRREEHTVANSIKNSAAQHQEDTIVVTYANHGADAKVHYRHAQHHQVLSSVPVYNALITSLLTTHYSLLTTPYSTLLSLSNIDTPDNEPAVYHKSKYNEQGENKEREKKKDTMLAGMLTMTIILSNREE